MSEKSDKFVSDLLEICGILVIHSGGRIELVSEEGGSFHYLTLDGDRLGKDVELLGLTGTLSGFDFAMMEFAQSLAIIKAKGCSDSWNAAREKCLELGKYLEGNGVVWRNIFSISAKR